MHSWLYYNKTLNSWSNVKYTIKDSICKLGKLHSSLETSLKKKKKKRTLQNEISQNLQPKKK